ncbi:MAG: DUF411 domain-containing protein [Gemmatimonadaceae bacterium]
MSRSLIFLLTSAAVLAACSPSTPEAEPVASAAAPPPVLASVPPSDSTTLVVYKESTCPCCNAWVDYMRDNGFRVVAYNVPDLDAVKRKHDIASNLQSCHTTEVGGYYVEGHVPVDLVRKLLAERPPIAGIAVPGMPVGSPGMEVGPPEPYDILGVDSAGRTAIFGSKGR